MQYCSMLTCAGEYAEVVQDYSGRVEDLVLKSRSTSKVWPVLLTHNGNATAIEENAWWKGMLLLPWANRIAYVSICSTHAAHISTDEEMPVLSIGIDNRARNFTCSPIAQLLY